MNNAAHVLASFYLILDTAMNLEEFQNKFSIETIVGSKVEITLPDGSVHKVSFSALTEFEISEFIGNDDEEEATKQIA
jgi:hypothetical protein